MKFENISTEEDFRTGQLRMAVLWEKEDVERFGDFFKRDMVDVVQLIGDDGVIGALISPYAGTVHVGEDDVMISAKALKAKLQYEYNRADEEGEVEAVCAYMHAHHIIEELETEARNG